MKINFLGTGAGKPSKNRNTTSIAISLCNNNYILIDCGEATQHQILKTNFKLNKLDSIYITHLHGDHIFGLPGLLSTLNECRTKELFIYGPNGLKQYIDNNINNVYCNINNYKINIIELEQDYEIINKIKIGSNNYKIECCKVEHTILCYSYTISCINKNINIKKLQPILEQNKNEIEKLGFKPYNKIIKYLKENNEVDLHNLKLKLSDYLISENNLFKITLCLDTCDTLNVVKYIKNTNILIHDSTFIIDSSENEKEITKKAIKYGHSTDRMAIKLFNKLNANKLFLTHLSCKYDKKIF